MVSTGASECVCVCVRVQGWIDVCVFSENDDDVIRGLRGSARFEGASLHKLEKMRWWWWGQARLKLSGSSRICARADGGKQWLSEPEGVRSTAPVSNRSVAVEIMKPGGLKVKNGIFWSRVI